MGLGVDVVATGNDVDAAVGQTGQGQVGRREGLDRDVEALRPEQALLLGQVERCDVADRQAGHRDRGLLRPVDRCAPGTSADHQ